MFMMGMSMTCVLLLTGLTGSLLAAAPENLLTNGSFESNPNGAHYGWTLSRNGGDSVQATWLIDSTSGTAKDGQNFCQVVVTKVSTQNWHVQLMDPGWPAKKGYSYHFSVWARADNSQTATISVYGDASSIYAYRISTDIHLTQDWQQFHQMFTSDVDGSGKVNFALVCGGAVGKYDFDDIVITEIPPSDDIYANGSFEFDAAGWQLWVQQDSSSAAATMEFPITGAKSGNKFCRINVTSPASSIDNDYEVQLQDGTWTCQMNYTYTLKCWVKSDSNRIMKIAAQAGASRNYGYLGGITMALTTDWQEFSYSYTSLDLAGSDSLNFVFYCGGAAGVYDLDSVSLTGVIDLHQTNRIHKKSARQFAIHCTPDRLHCIKDPTMITPFIVGIYSIQGRLLSTQAITTTGRSFDLPRPPAGAWIIKAGSNRSDLIVVP
jgi:hypothetical protein